MYDTTKPYKKQIFNLIEQTWETPYVSVTSDIYPIIDKKFTYPEIDHTDGIGTKGIYHWQQKTFAEAAIDALAMNLNDLLLMRAVPYKLQNHITIPEDDHDAILQIIDRLSEECVIRDIAITGGETSIHNNSDALDISVTVSGFIPNYKENRFEIGDTLLGIRSSGLHSNGFTKVRELFDGEFKKDFVEPTKIYHQIPVLYEKYDINGMMHITGGAFTKLKDLLPKADAKIKLTYYKPQNIFKEIYEKGVSDEEMYKTFNCGFGFVFSAPPIQAEEIARFSDFHKIGEVTKGKGRVIIESCFSDEVVIL